MERRQAMRQLTLDFGLFFERFDVAETALVD
jgi:hypothetical protein